MSDEIKRECPHCHGSLERYEDPSAVKIIERLTAEVEREKTITNEMRRINSGLCGQISDLSAALASSETAFNALTERFNAMGELWKKDKERVAELEKVVSWIGSQKNLFFAECSQAEEIISKCNAAMEQK